MTFHVTVRRNPLFQVRMLPRVLPADGEAATIEVGTVTTLPAGSPATVVNSGTENAAVLDFGIPEGDPGVVQSVVAGTNVTVDNTDPANPVINVAGSGSGDMLAATYDPQNIADDAFDRANHTGTQLAATISNFSTAADARISAAIGVTVQGYDTDLAAIAALTTNAAGRSILTLSDPNADRIAFWDDSAGSYAHLSLDTGLSISGTTLSLDADLATIAGLTATTDNFIVSVSSAWASRTPAQVRTTLAVIGAAEDFIPAEDFTPAATNGAQAGIRYMGTNGQALFYYAFDTGTQETAYAKWLPPKRYDGGTITFAPIWTAESGSGTVEFELSAVAVSNDDALDVALGTAQASADTLLSANDSHQGPTSSAITISGTFADGDYVWLRIQRDVANDTLGVDAQLLGIKIFYTTDQANDA